MFTGSAFRKAASWFSLMVDFALYGLPRPFFAHHKAYVRCEGDCIFVVLLQFTL